jgi:uncharacterized membrane protein YhaH (DUF805 family)
MIGEHRARPLPARAETVKPAVVLAAVETVALFGALVWSYVAVVAMVYPERLDIPLASWIPVRRDAVATLAFAVSVLAFFVSQWCRSAMPLAWWRTMLVYSAMVSVYLMGNSITHPATMNLPLTHLLSFPLERTVLCISLICLASSFFALRVVKQRASDTGKSSEFMREHDHSDDSAR